MAVASFAVVQKGTKDFTKPAGTGPYKVDEYKQGERVEWSRNDNYWMSGKPAARLGCASSQFQDPASKVQSVISGDLDIGDPVEFTACRPSIRPAASSRWRLRTRCSFPSSCDQTQAPFNDLKVRQAFKHAIDRER